MKKPNYGIDAPGVILGLTAAGCLGLAVRIAVRHWPGMPGGAFLGNISYPVFFIAAIVMLWSSKVGKFWVRDRMIAAVPWRGDEKVLDIGCGHGLLLIGAAKKLTNGKSIGIDIWSNTDQHDNSPEDTLANAAIEGVQNRIELKTADARQLPFEDASFDVVFSSYAIHNIPNADGRRKAIFEIARVLKTGGRVSIVDIFHTGAYMSALRDAGIKDVKRSWPFPLFFLPTRIVTGAKR